MALAQEVKFILEQAIAEASIKTHEIEWRVKDFESLERKLRKNAEAAEDPIHDIVGVRVICLFRSDLTAIGNVIQEEFDVEYTDDKINQGTDSFGYMSVHYIAKLKKNLSGRRYDTLKNITFEIQVRTLCMHAWAAISHYLDYKSEWDIPDNLKKGLNALSGLFFVADSQYEQLFDARAKSLSEAGDSQRDEDGKTPLNLDTMVAALNLQFPDRRQDKANVSELIGELVEAGFDSIDDVFTAVKEGEGHLKESEQEALAKAKKPLDSKYFSAVGAVRVSLRSTHPAYRIIYDKAKESRFAARRREVKAKVKTSSTKLSKN